MTLSQTSKVIHTRKRNHWWSHSCTLTTNRLKFWFSLWKTCDRPRAGVVYDSYKNAKNKYRRACRQAMNNSTRLNFRKCDNFFKDRNNCKMWNIIKESRRNVNDNHNVISNEKLKVYFSEKFSYNQNDENNFIQNLREQVHHKVSGIENVNYDFTLSQHLLCKFVKDLKLNCSAGSDGVTAEHLKYAVGTKLILHFCNLLSTCFKYGVVPESFNHGILVPILKKSTLDSTVAKHYRPVIVSTVFSKLAEMYILHECENVKTANEYQFGFVKHRGTTTAISLAHDVSMYCTQKGSQMYVCSLDAEGAFDAIPHPVLFSKTMNILSDMSWRLLYFWYAKIKVKIKWNGFSEDILIGKGTRQGGLTLPLLFNLFYEPLVDILSKLDGGVSIGKHKYNIFCYADDILLASTTVINKHSKSFYY